MVARRALPGEGETAMTAPAWKLHIFSGACDVKENDRSSLQIPPLPSYTKHTALKIHVNIIAFSVLPFSIIPNFIMTYSGVF